MPFQSKISCISKTSHFQLKSSKLSVLSTVTLCCICTHKAFWENVEFFFQNFWLFFRSKNVGSANSLQHFGPKKLFFISKNLGRNYKLFIIGIHYQRWKKLSTIQLKRFLRSKTNGPTKLFFCFSSEKPLKLFCCKTFFALFPENRTPN